jgi:hypothetical protein
LKATNSLIQKKKVLSNIASGVTGVVLFVLAGWIALHKYPQVLTQSAFPAIIPGLVISIFMFIIQGIELKWLLKRNGLNLSRFDIVSLPFSMNLWGFFIPIQGSFFYFIAFIKAKYKISVFSLTGSYFWLFFLGLSVDGFIGLFAYFFGLKNEWLLGLFVLMLTSMLFLFAFAASGQKILYSNSWLAAHKFMEKIQLTLKSTQLFFWQDYLKLGILSAILTALTTIWTWQIATYFNLNIDLTTSLIEALLVRFSLLLKVTPVNVGVLQFATGAIFAALGYAASTGVFISLWQQALMLIVSIPAGLLGTLMNRRHFSMKSIFTKGFS